MSNLNKHRIGWTFNDTEYFAIILCTEQAEIIKQGKSTHPNQKDRAKTSNNNSRGLGDTIKKAIDKVTRGKVKQCGGCKKRQEKLNKLLPYGDKDNGD